MTACSAAVGAAVVLLSTAETAAAVVMAEGVGEATQAVAAWAAV